MLDMTETLFIPLSQQQKPRPPVGSIEIVPRPYGGQVIIGWQVQVALKRIWLMGVGAVLGEILVGNLLVHDAQSWSNAPVVPVAVHLTVRVNHPEHPLLGVTDYPQLGIEYEVNDRVRPSFMEDDDGRR